MGSADSKSSSRASRRRVGDVPRRYFEQAWRHGWVTTGPHDFPAPAVYGVDFDILRDLGVFEPSDP